MKKQLKEIELAFENVDTLTIPAEYIMGIQLRGLSSGIYYSYAFDPDEVHEEHSVDSLTLKFSSGILKDNLVTKFSSNGASRLASFDDLVNVKLRYTDGSESPEYFVTWSEDNADSYNEYNSYQENHLYHDLLTDENILFIYVGKRPIKKYPFYEDKTPITWNFNPEIPDQQAKQATEEAKKIRLATSYVDIAKEETKLDQDIRANLMYLDFSEDEINKIADILSDVSEDKQEDLADIISGFVDELDEQQTSLRDEAFEEGKDVGYNEGVAYGREAGREYH